MRRTDGISAAPRTRPMPTTRRNTDGADENGPNGPDTEPRHIATAGVGTAGAGAGITVRPPAAGVRTTIGAFRG
ncbi:hypothetical protein, partial [Rhodococcus sp. BS-15]|uniref:hypothetical protein n=1 Tax=Rhodococcus sp. BS-15 TaxID=1304954 RepID=UPI0011AE58B2